jgi:hypothetical protein
MLLAAGWGVTIVAQAMWMYFDLVLRKEAPNPFVGDILLFLSNIPFLAALFLQPHLDPLKGRESRGTVDFLLLLLWWLNLYLFFVVPWQYVVLDEAKYGSNYNRLNGLLDIVLLLTLGFLWSRCLGRWKWFYAFFFWRTIAHNDESLGGERGHRQASLLSGEVVRHSLLGGYSIVHGRRLIRLHAGRRSGGREEIAGARSCDQAGNAGRAVFAGHGRMGSPQSEFAFAGYPVPRTGYAGHYAGDDLSGVCQAASAEDGLSQGQPGTSGSLRNGPSYRGPKSEVL